MKSLNLSVAFPLLSLLVCYAASGQQAKHHTGMQNFNYAYVQTVADSLKDAKLDMYIKKERRNSIVFLVSFFATSLVLLSQIDQAYNYRLVLLSVPLSSSIFSFTRKRFFKRQAILRYNQIVSN
jgi:hypothetical protein